jgi:uncharacterized Ntn-hydrolase superfamily protein
MLVVTGRPTGRSWEDRVIDIRVEDAAEPLAELRRLLRIKRAYQTDEVADRLEEAGDLKAAAVKREEGVALAPDLEELAFWAGLQIAINGDVERGAQLIARAIQVEPRWTETIHRLVAVDRLNADVAKAIEARLTAASRRP